MREVIISQRLPVLALRGICVFPEMVVHFDAGRDRSIRAVDEAVKHGQEIFLATQRDIDEEDPGPERLYEVGVVAHIRQVLKMPGGLVRILVEGSYRAHVIEWLQEEQYLQGRVESLPDLNYQAGTSKAEALLRQVLSRIEE